MQIVLLSDVYQHENVKSFISRHQGTVPSASIPKEDDVISVSNCVGHGSISFGYASEEPMEIKRVTRCRVFALAKVEALTEPEQHWCCTVDPVEV
jgi:hypothetical protein